MIVCTLRVLLSETDCCQVITSFEPLIPWTRVQAGCRACYLLTDIEEPRALILWEEWETQEDLDCHLRSEDYRRVIAAMELSQEAPEIRFDTLASRAGFEVVEAARMPRGSDEGPLTGRPPPRGRLKRKRTTERRRENPDTVSNSHEGS